MQREITIEDLGRADAVYPTENYLSNGSSLKSWLLTKDHKRIAILYMVGVTFFFFGRWSFRGPHQVGALNARE